MVYVQSVDGAPLMPCSEAKARHLLKQHRVRRVRNPPFTIRLKSVVDGHVQPVSLGVDSGYRHIGLSATTDDPRGRANGVSADKIKKGVLL